MQIGYTAAFDRVGHSELLFKLRFAGNSADILNIITGFLSGREQRVVEDIVRSEDVIVVFIVFQGSMLGLCFFYCTLAICQ